MMNDPNDRFAPRVPRGSRPDAETSDKVYLIKRVSTLRATYQVRLLTFLAAGRGKKLVLRVPSACQFDPALEELLLARPDAIEREDLA
jgi:hypothetical protein